MIRSFLTGIDPARQLRKDPSLVVLGLFMLASFSGYLAFVRGAAPVLPPWLAPGTLEIVRSAFTQLQIVLFAKKWIARFVADNRGVDSCSPGMFQKRQHSFKRLGAIKAGTINQSLQLGPLTFLTKFS